MTTNTKTTNPEDTLIQHARSRVIDFAKQLAEIEEDDHGNLSDQLNRLASAVSRITGAVRDLQETEETIRMRRLESCHENFQASKKDGDLYITQLNPQHIVLAVKAIRDTCNRGLREAKQVYDEWRRVLDSQSVRVRDNLDLSDTQQKVLAARLIEAGVVLEYRACL